MYFKTIKCLFFCQRNLFYFLKKKKKKSKKVVQYSVASSLCVNNSSPLAPSRFSTEYEIRASGWRAGGNRGLIHCFPMIESEETQKIRYFAYSKAESQAYSKFLDHSWDIGESTISILQWRCLLLTPSILQQWKFSL